ncbi:MAG: glycosyltransferase family 2 protein [Candidatus Babeliales bacterium]|jgi:dolichol-phosphate mannosyltransferase
MKKISIIVACYNEALNIRTLYERVITVMQTLPDYDFELIYVDNASTDNSLSIYHELATQDPHVTALVMSRNFGTNQSSILAGMRYATGDAVIFIDGDLQDPPELIPAFVTTWQQGYEVVYGIRVKRKGSILRRIGYTCFYRLFRMLSYLDIPLDAGDTALIDRKIVDIITSLPEKDLYIRGLRTWAGFRQTGINYVREDRAGGKTSNSFFANFFWAKKAIVNFSYKPLEFISRTAIALGCISILSTGWYLVSWYRWGMPRATYTLLLGMLIMTSLIFAALGTLAEYFIRMFHEIKGRPVYIVRSIINQKTLAQQSGIHVDRRHNEMHL